MSEAKPTVPPARMPKSPPPMSRVERIRGILSAAPAYRLEQIERALFEPAVRGWEDVTTLPKRDRSLLTEVPWMSVREAGVFVSRSGDTWKALLRTEDDLLFETVLMENRRGQWTLCVSSQIGCAMGCTFCATGTMGLTRSLTADEIVDQYRYWARFLVNHPAVAARGPRVSNVVFMGMGEPLANYENVKRAMQIWLAYTDLGPTRITVSTVGVLPQLEKLTTDPDWPHVRIAISLHSANQERRREIVPTTAPQFLEKLADWSRRYQSHRGKRRHHVTYEYTLLNGVNDAPAHARELAVYIARTGSSKVNVIPWNLVPGKAFARSQEERIHAFKKVLRDAGVTVTQRKTMGDDIAAACGQLVTAARSSVEQRQRSGGSS